MIPCDVCNKIFKNNLALAGHKRMHGISGGKILPILCSCIITKQEMPYQYLEKYQKSLISCKNCNTLFKPTAGRKIFCGQSCSATYNNKLREPRTLESKAKTSKAVIKTLESKPKKIKIVKIKQKYVKILTKPEVVGPNSTLFVCKCRHCNIKFVSRLKRKYCLEHRNLYVESSKAGFKFTFNVYDYPELFDLTMLNQVGFYAPGGKSGRWNLDGLSRDHRVSVNESIANNYDPYYITHPLNCELMTHTDNNKKKTQSSITYSALKKLVDDYDSKK